jgi:putative SOS response-associated peptidase YedK
MCARYTLTRTTLGAIVAELGADADDPAGELFLPRYNIGPSQACIVTRARGAAPVLTMAKWGLRVEGRVVVNLRAETAGRYPRLRRCLVPADGFFEWAGAKGQKRPIWFHRPGGELLLLAGLLDAAVGAVATFAVLTAPARPPVRAIHDRMPVVLGIARGRSWLVGGGRPDVEGLELIATEVSSRVNSVANDDALVLSAADAPSGQMRLL